MSENLKCNRSTWRIYCECYELRNPQNERTTHCIPRHKRSPEHKITISQSAKLSSTELIIEHNIRMK